MAGTLIPGEYFDRSYSFINGTCDFSGFYDGDSIYIGTFDTNPQGKGIGQECLKQIRKYLPYDVKILTTQEVSYAKPFWDKMRKRGLVDVRIPKYQIIPNLNFEKFAANPIPNNNNWTFVFKNQPFICNIQSRMTFYSPLNHGLLVITGYYANTPEIGRECLEYMNDKLSIKIAVDYNVSQTDRYFWELMGNYGLIVE